MRFSVYLDCILNENGSFQIEIMISAAHICYGGNAILRENFEKMCNLMRLGEYFDQILN